MVGAGATLRVFPSVHLYQVGWCRLAMVTTIGQGRGNL